MKVTHKENWAIVHVEESLNLAGRQLLLDTVKPLFRNSIFLAIDLTECDFLNSGGLSGLISILKEVRLLKGKLFLFGLKSYVQEVFNITNLNSIFEIYEKFEDVQEEDSPVFCRNQIESIDLNFAEWVNQTFVKQIPCTQAWCFLPNFDEEIRSGYIWKLIPIRVWTGVPNHFQSHTAIASPTIAQMEQLICPIGGPYTLLFRYYQEKKGDHWASRCHYALEDRETNEVEGASIQGERSEALFSLFKNAHREGKLDGLA